MFTNKKTGEEVIEYMSYTKLDEFISENTDLEIVMKPLPIMDPTKLGMKKPPDGFKEVLKNISKNNPNNNIDTF